MFHLRSHATGLKVDYKLSISVLRILVRHFLYQNSLHFHFCRNSSKKNPFFLIVVCTCKSKFILRRVYRTESSVIYNSHYNRAIKHRYTFSFVSFLTCRRNNHLFQFPVRFHNSQFWRLNYLTGIELFFSPLESLNGL